MPREDIFDIIVMMIDLPIDDHQHHIRNELKKNPVIIITAETGAGKSTRIPYWFWKEGKKVSVTQPRRIAARSLSYYQAQITATRWGAEIGYQTGFDRKFSRETRLIYLTDGVQMVKEIKRQRNDDILILDEIHEWNLNQEVLIGLVRRGLDEGVFRKTGRKVIIMSATLHTGQLSEFLNQAPVISVPGRSYPVTMYHNHPDFILSDTIQLIEAGKNVLVFQPGKNEIDNFIILLKQTLEQDKLKSKILPLHSELSIRDQARVFDHYPVPKVIVSTDIAQTSLTIDDIDAVIDTGIKKEIRVVRGIEGLYPTEISTSECMQRAGRAGRVKQGRYILCAELGLKDRPPFAEPEIRRLNLESVILRLIKWGLDPLEFSYFHPPKKNLIFKALKLLEQFGAISQEGTITGDGERMAEIPVSIRSSRLLMEARKAPSEVLDNALKLISIMETKGIVNKEYQGEKYYTGSLNSDLINQLYLWNNPRKNRKSINFKKFMLAKDIYRELKNRLGIKTTFSTLSKENVKSLIRVMLSAFLDHIYIKSGQKYTRDNEERELDKNSVLFAILPEIIVGSPFDLVMDWENPKTGEREKKCLSLITFATELSPRWLDELKPYSYAGHQVATIEKDQCKIMNSLFFGGKKILEFESQPDWNDPGHRALFLPQITAWCETKGKQLKFYPQLMKAKKQYREIRRIGTRAKINLRNLPSFDKAWSRYLNGQLRHHFRSNDLKLFFSRHPGFLKLNLSQLLSPGILSKLKRINWPKAVIINNIEYPLKRINNRPFVNLNMTQFEKIEKDSLTLPTGVQPGLILENRKFDDWDVAVYHFNRWKKQNIFETKWKNKRKPVRIEDLADIEFPVSFESGQDKSNSPFIFFSAPRIQEEGVYLVHFLEEREAVSYFKSMRSEWEKYMKEHKKQKINDIFKEKGWTVK